MPRPKIPNEKRTEFVLYKDNERDKEIIRFLMKLPYGSASEFIKEAIFRRIVEHEDEQVDFESVLETLRAEMLNEFAALRALMKSGAVLEKPPTIPDEQDRYDRISSNLKNFDGMQVRNLRRD